MLNLGDLGLSVYIPFGFLGLYRYIWFTIRLLAYYIYKPMQPVPNPTFQTTDVTIIVPTIDAGEEFVEAAHSWLANDPRQIIIVTEHKMVLPLEDLARKLDPTLTKIRVLAVSKPNKRRQMVAGIQQTFTDIIVFADDDAIWGPEALKWMLACFENPRMGGVGTCQSVKSMNVELSVWEVLAAFRMTQRNIEVAAATHIDGGIPCLSGRTAAYRTSILKDPQFCYQFTNDLWIGKYPLNSGDDKFLTRWLVRHGWSTYAQVCPEANVQSTFKNNWHFLKQVLRWTRNTWRSDFRSLFMEGKIWTVHPYVAYTMVEKFLTPFTLLSGPVLVGLAIHYQSTPLPSHVVLMSYAVWILGMRTLKLLPHWNVRPQDFKWILHWIVFNYYFSLMKIYSLFTLHVTAWGTRVGVDDDDDKKKVVSPNPSQFSEAYGVRRASIAMDMKAMG
jgi:cellulose synthase/poly-beta-1,6-N-acetylglucosamine synthase-like glycosyltransferase